MGVYELLTWSVPAIFILLHLHVINVVELQSDQVCGSEKICLQPCAGLSIFFSLLSGLWLGWILLWWRESKRSFSQGMILYVLWFKHWGFTCAGWLLRSSFGQAIGEPKEMFRFLDWRWLCVRPLVAARYMAVCVCLCLLLDQVVLPNDPEIQSWRTACDSIVLYQFLHPVPLLR